MTRSTRRMVTGEGLRASAYDGVIFARSVVGSVTKSLKVTIMVMRVYLFRWLLYCCGLLPSLIHAVPYEAVFINDADVASYGGVFPFPRRLLGTAIQAAEKAGAKAVVLKFFLDLPSQNPEDDALLTKAIHNAKIPVVLQANLDPSAERPITLPPRFFRNDVPPMPGLPNGDRGWLPLAALSEKAYAVGFIDGLNPAPMIEMYQGKSVPSLYLVCLELVLGPARFDGESMTFAGQTLPLKKGALTLPYPASDDWKAMSFSTLLAGEAGSRLSGSVVVLGYEGKLMHGFATPIGSIKAHRLFFEELNAAYDTFHGD